MNIEELRKICLSLPSVTEDLKWGNHLCFCIGGKLFLIAGLDESPVTASFKTDEEDFAELSGRSGFRPAPYFSKHSWIHTSDIDLLSKKEWEYLVGKSYALIRLKLSKKTLSAMGLKVPAKDRKKISAFPKAKKQIEQQSLQDSLEQLRESFNLAGDDEKAISMSAYMKNKFSYLGIQKPVRETIVKPWLKELPKLDWSEQKSGSWWLWKQEEREFQYVAMELLFRNKKLWTEESPSHFEKLIVTKSWWDSVDYIAASLIGAYFEKFPESKKAKVREWIKSENMWLNRTAIIFQLKYRANTDEELLYSSILPHLQSKEFFLQKAIGWSLRQYAYTYPTKVKQFIRTHDLKPLSLREAMKHLA